ncbi:2-amino-4-hydroxy-6-hydroxymethyldihydropteridine diphosphokinase [Marivita sp. XM-24bin2]|jgi:2-amino-4-hydroxy-6-hydroxymethyldihydropteridine diphosphokinase|uniref:2-amino-4-hydroxy-6- hydroxymethyldihydropteridine diphosphokinase n=1 Tax=unclassified Marivita TaxID=2632480 RepID=UPI000D7915B3|nr:2-amino-4-hydroxy-6-hydroxymethyldihydropteridine diphosphokinase [Marivita sp. XM-24bin2]MCR9108123.1 2-amino-4-hydroxy-6-hydroxymethyldihydropteridine diphosphokinase [Paracoccaceae bacterium]PWL37043.1 MAG: 2-amino-4-hydroxy-6-hydroxymethyldihydropteridine diphosphokinase [Marivita sp. XM-24bin2]
MNDFLIALGANLPVGNTPPKETLESAIREICINNIYIEAISNFYKTPCFPAGAGPDYVNAAAHLKSDLASKDMLAQLHEIEANHGRRRLERWGMRTLDLDLIACGDSILPDFATYEAWRTLPLEEQRQQAPADLVLPHPRLQDRAFVLVPLRDIAADWRHPVLKKTVREMCDALSPEALAEIVLLDV